MVMNDVVQPPRGPGQERRLERTTFETSRLLDFVSEKELTFQCGYGPESWPLVILKELLDNALDACEERGIPPAITVTVDETAITVADNGPGIPPETVERMLDFSVRVSSREAYVAPDRGAQGNALKTIVAMPFVLDGTTGRVDIAGGGTLNEITIAVDRIHQRPNATVTKSAKLASFVRVHWPASASSLRDGEDDFLQVALDFTTLNPHLSLTVDYFGARKLAMAATDPGWAKWTPSSPTPAHWYRLEDLERLIAAYLAHDLDHGRLRTVREFVAEFKGLSATGKQKTILGDLGLARAPLSDLTRNGDLDHDLIRRLLDAMKAQSKPVQPAALGLIGRDHLQARLGDIGIVLESFEYRKDLTLGADGLPQVTEIAFGALDDASVERRFVCGVNWSAAWVNPFRTLGKHGEGLDAWLRNARASAEEPIVIVVHVAHPRVQYTDRGKSSVASRG